MRIWWISSRIQKPSKRSGRTPTSFTKDTGGWKFANCGEVTQMNAWLETEWAGVAQVFRFRRYVKDGEKEREETVSGITNLRRQESACRSSACPPASSLAHRKSVTFSA